MTDWQQRVVDEKKELDEKLVKLEAFLRSSPVGLVSPEELSLLDSQQTIMRSYSNILGLRIENFTASPGIVLDWPAATAHFDAVRKQYQDLEGMPGVNTTLALRAVFDPLAKRYNAGERTTALFEEMMSVE